MGVQDDIKAQLGESMLDEEKQALGIKDNKEEKPKDKKEIKEEEHKEEAHDKEEEVNEADAMEEKARAMGWNPEGEKSAAEWVRTAELFDEIKARGKENKDLKKALDELVKQLGDQRALGKKEALRELEEQRRQAIIDADVDAVENVDKLIAATKEDKQEVNTQEVLESFIERNKDWYQDSSPEAVEIRKYANARDQELVARGLSAEDHLATIEKDVRKHFASFFDKTETVPNKVSSASGGMRSVNRTRGLQYADLSYHQKKIANMAVSEGLMTMEQYLKQLSEARK